MKGRGGAELGTSVYYRDATEGNGVQRHREKSNVLDREAW